MLRCSLSERHKSASTDRCFSKLALLCWQRATVRRLLGILHCSRIFRAVLSPYVTPLPRIFPQKFTENRIKGILAAKAAGLNPFPHKARPALLPPQARCRAPHRRPSPVKAACIQTACLGAHPHDFVHNQKLLLLQPALSRPCPAPRASIAHSRKPHFHALCSSPSPSACPSSSPSLLAWSRANSWRAPPSRWPAALWPSAPRAPSCTSTRSMAKAHSPCRLAPFPRRQLCPAGLV